MTPPAAEIAPLAPSASPPFPTATIPRWADAFTGPDSPFVEEEFLATGRASEWTTTAQPGDPSPVGVPVPFRTRVLVRRPRHATRASGAVVVEPLHPMCEEAHAWAALGDHLLRTGGSWVGVTVTAPTAALLRDTVDPERYRDLDIPSAGLQWDILGSALAAIREGRVPDLRAERIHLAGWSATGSVVRVFLREGFAARHGAPLDAGLVMVSSGGAGEQGYPALRPGDASVALDDPRRAIRDVGVPVIELLSECESETHEAVAREDSDTPGDAYRLYQVAGTGHIESWAGDRHSNHATLAGLGQSLPAPEIRERRGDGRLDLVARAVFALLDRWVADDVPPPSAPRLSWDGPAFREGRDLERDADGNAVGGIRPPWIEAPLARYAPHGTPASVPTSTLDWTPMADADFGAWLCATMDPFPGDELRLRYRDGDGYRAAFTEATAHLVAAGFLLADDAAEVLASADERWSAATGSRA